MVNFIYKFIELKTQLSDFWPCPFLLSKRALGGEVCIYVVYVMSWQQENDSMLRSLRYFLHPCASWLWNDSSRQLWTCNNEA